MRFDLPPTGTDKPPAFLTTLACQDWLAHVPVANPVEAQVMLLKQINLLNLHSLDAQVRLDLLELLREAVADVQNDVAKKFAGRPLPFTPPEQAALDGTLALWHALVLGYLRLIELAASEPGLAPRRALIAQRAFGIFADWQVDLCRGQQLPGASYWREVHRAFAAAERMGVLDESVPDTLRHGSSSTTALGTFAECLLLHTASPFELPPRQLNWIARWARRWGTKLPLTPVAVAEATPGSALYVDLAGEHPPTYRPTGTEPRALATAALRKSIKGRLILLAEGQSPSKLNLGEDCTQPAAGMLLKRVYQRWCKGGAQRKHERKPASGGCDFIVGLNAIHYYFSGRQAFKPPLKDDQALRKDREELAMFGDRGRRQEDNYSEMQGYEIESWAVMDDWQLLDQSSSGLRLTRPLKSGVRVGAGNLVAIKLEGSNNYVLGGVRWALHDGSHNSMHTNNDMLTAGVQLFPGVAQPVAVMATDVREPYRQALLVPAVPAVDEPETLIIPAGSFRVGRPFEYVLGAAQVRVTLEHILDRAVEFERCTFRRV